MAIPREGTRSGFAHVETAVALLRRARLAHPTKCLFEASELEWFWSNPRSTDGIDQLFWFDESGQPMACAVLTDWGDGSSLMYEAITITPIVLPDAAADWALHVLRRGLEHAASLGIARVELEVEVDDQPTRALLSERGFVVGDGAMVGCWLDTGRRPSISELGAGYQLRSRAELTHRPHHMARPTRPDFEDRLAATSTYRQDLDLVVVADNGDYAGHGMFWYDAITRIGVVEPMRTADEHQQRGIARHILTAGIERLAELGAERIAIGYDPDNPASGHLYRSVGFEPQWQTQMLAGPTGPTN